VKRTAFAGLLLLPLAPASARPADGRAIIVDTGCGQRRAADLSIELAGRAALVRTRCVAEGASADRWSIVRAASPIVAGRGIGLASLLAPDTADHFSIQLAPVAATQRVRVARPDGRLCLDLVAAPRARHILAARFLGADGDWRPTLDYQIDEGCSVLAVRAGNRLLLARLGRPRSLDFDRLRITLR
jgi:hypothetical protein